jgi:hypothetical protein
MRLLVPAAALIVPVGAAAAAANPTQASLADVVQALKIDTVPANHKVVVDTLGSPQNSGSSAKVKLAPPKGLFPALIANLSLRAFDATSSDVYVRVGLP